MTFNDETDIAFYDGNKEKNSISCPSTGVREDGSRKVENGRKISQRHRMVEMEQW